MFIDRLRVIISIRETPHKTALAFSLGVFIGISPLLGLHILLGVVTSWILRLNTFATIAGVYLTNLWTIVPVYIFSTWVGAKCLGIERIIPKVDWSNITFGYTIDTLEHLLVPFICGTLLVGSAAAIISYFIIYTATKKSKHLFLS